MYCHLEANDFPRCRLGPWHPGWGLDKDGVPTFVSSCRLSNSALKLSLIKVMGVLDIKYTDEHQLTRESCSSNNMIADSALVLILGIGKSPASVKGMLIYFFVE